MKKLVVFFFVLVFVLLPLGVKADVRVNEREGSIYAPKIATNLNNQVVITWTLVTDTDYVMVQRFDSFGQRNDTNMVVCSQPDSQVIASSVIMNSIGRFVISWGIQPPPESSYTMLDEYISVFDFNGTVIDTIKVHDTQTGWHFASDMAIDSLGKFVCVWAEYDTLGIWCLKGQLFNEQFQKIDTNILVTDTAGYIYKAVGMNGQGRFSVAYNPGLEATSVCVKIFYNNGQLDTFFVADQSMKGRNPDLAMNYQGQYVVVWIDTATAYVGAQIFDKANKRIGPNFPVSNIGKYLTYSQPRVAINEKGNFVVIWEDIVSSDSIIYAQRYLSDSTKIGEKYRINNSSQARVGQNFGDFDVAATDEMIYFTWVGSNGTNVYGKRVDWCYPTKRGDANSSGETNISDVIYLINYLFRSGLFPQPFVESGNVNGDKETNIVDVVYLINYLFRGGQPPYQVPDFASS